MHLAKMRSITIVFFVIFTCEGINGLFLPGIEYKRLRDSAPPLSWMSRSRRVAPKHRIINPNEDCFLMTSEEEQLYFKSPSDEPTVCGIYMIADPDKKIEVTFDYLSVKCDNDGLVSWVDGWELSGQVWPADSWSDDRVVDACDERPARTLVSHQNAALIQYRVPARGQGFAITIKHVKNTKPCNVMLFGSEGVYTLRNHGQAGNCSVISVSPSTVRILNVDVGQTVKQSRKGSMEIETGTIHHCKKRGLSDYVDIGGASGLDHTKMFVFENVCGLDSSEGHHSAKIACEDSVVRLVSSGKYYNSVTLAFAPLSLEELDQADLMCPF